MVKKPKGKQIKRKKKPSIEIKDLSKNAELTEEDIESVTGGTTFRTSTNEPSQIIRVPPSPPRIGYPDK